MGNKINRIALAVVLCLIVLAVTAGSLYLTWVTPAISLGFQLFGTLAIMTVPDMRRATLQTGGVAGILTQVGVSGAGLALWYAVDVVAAGHWCVIAGAVGAVYNLRKLRQLAVDTKALPQ